MEKIGATIEDAKILKISELWARKPRGLRFNDTDALIVTAKTKDGTAIRETFYFCLKPDGTFNVDTLSKASKTNLARQRLARFLKHYITDNVDEYNLKKGVKQWKGKKVSAVKAEGSGFIYVP